MQTAVLAIADLLVLRRALTYVTPKPVLIMGGVLLIVQLSFVIICITLGELISLYGLGLWSVLNLALFLLFLFILKKYEGQKRWVAVNLPYVKQNITKKRNFLHIQMGRSG